MSLSRDVFFASYRPAMYVGDTKFFGFIHNIVSAFDIMLDNGATWITIDGVVSQKTHWPLRMRADAWLLEG